MEILVHNISHADLIIEISILQNSPQPASKEEERLQLQWSDAASPRSPRNIAPVVLLQTLARPKFSTFHYISQQIMETIEELTTQSYGVVQPEYAPVYTRPSGAEEGKEVIIASERLPIGYNLRDQPIPISIKEHLEEMFLVKNEVAFNKVIHTTGAEDITVAITAVYFPLIAVLLPKWQATLQQHQSTSSQQNLYLISGSGIPRNDSHLALGNSTQATAMVMIKFINRFYPRIETCLIHSGSNIFRYDDNVAFVNLKLRPLLEENRMRIVDKCGDRWKSHYHITLAYAGGTPARLSALNASLRLYHPSYLHIWQLKTFWHEFKLCLDDIDFHSFENIETSPAIPISQADSTTRLLVSEMRKFRDQLQDTSSQDNELVNFWLRKTKKPVLAILIVQKLNAQPTVYRGINAEVSMPTGSLCAERNAIGSALAKDPTLRRRDLKMIGVLSVWLPLGDNSKEKFCSISQEQPNVKPLRSPLLETILENAAANTAESKTRERPPKRPRTFSCDDETSITKDNSQTHSVAKNPLAPCGACKEWLIKIAEANPSLRIITFTDMTCENIFINQIM